MKRRRWRTVVLWGGCTLCVSIAVAFAVSGWWRVGDVPGAIQVEVQIRTIAGRLLHKHVGDRGLQSADLSQLDLREAMLREVDLTNAGLEFSDLRQADMRGAVLYWAILFNADLREANLERADLRGADLKEANLERAILRHANLGYDKLGSSGAQLQGANLVDADLTHTNMKGAAYDSATRFPTGFDPVTAGMVVANHCKRCGYNLTGLTEPRCPECGEPFEARGDAP